MTPDDIRKQAGTLRNCANDFLRNGEFALAEEATRKAAWVEACADVVEAADRLVKWYASRTGSPSGSARVSRAEEALARIEGLQP